MTIKRTMQIGNPVLRNKSKPVLDVRATKTKLIARNLIDSMRHHGLVGMAAAQIGIGQRIFVTEIRNTDTREQKETDRARVFINPKIIRFSRKQASGIEGCGSVAHAGLFANVDRPERVIVEAFDEKGKKFRLSAAGLLARIIQHEFDHLEGMVFLDRLSDMKGLMSREEYLKVR